MEDSVHSSMHPFYIHILFLGSLCTLPILVYYITDDIIFYPHCVIIYYELFINQLIFIYYLFLLFFAKQKPIILMMEQGQWKHSILVMPKVVSITAVLERVHG